MSRRLRTILGLLIAVAPVGNYLRWQTQANATHNPDGFLPAILLVLICVPVGVGLILFRRGGSGSDLPPEALYRNDHPGGFD